MAIESGAARPIYVPALPTLWPSMLWRHRTSQSFLPFSSPSTQYVYFARNAVWLAVRMLGLQGSEVLVPAYHHGVEVEALRDAGAIPCFYRIGSRWEVDLEDVERKIGPRTRALYLIHYAGFPGPVAQMRALADKHGLLLIEDCALALLSAEGDTPLGATGDVSVYCLYKSLPVPNGGALVLHPRLGLTLPVPISPPWKSTVQHLVSSMLQNMQMRGGRPGHWVRQLGRGLAQLALPVRGGRYVATGTRHFDRAHVELGMSPLSLKIARAHDLRQVVESRRRNFFFLLGRLRDIVPTLFSELPPGVCPLFFPVRVKDKGEVLARLAQRGVEAVDFWRFFHPSCDASQFGEVAELRRSVVEIPCHQDLGPDAMSHVVSAVREAVKGSSRMAASGGR